MSSVAAAVRFAALEGLRLDLPRLHAEATDLAPLTTLLDAARGLGDEANRLVDAQAAVQALLVQEGR